jgi:hypothetical protein
MWPTWIVWMTTGDDDDVQQASWVKEIGQTCHGGASVSTWQTRDANFLPFFNSISMAIFFFCIFYYFNT